MKIVYIHGFGSRVDPASEKYQALSNLGEVVPIAPDYSKNYETNASLVESLAGDAGLLVGTSMGGYLASRVAANTGLPFVAINPVLLPQRTLSKYLGTREDYYGSTYTLSSETVSTYPVFAPGNNGLVLLDLDDELINAHETIACLAEHMQLHTFAGGSHRFAHIRESIPLIQRFLEGHHSGPISDTEQFLPDNARDQLHATQVLELCTEDEDLHCPICNEIVLKKTTPELRDEPPEPCPCAHVRFLFLDQGSPHNLDTYEFIDENVREWLEIEAELGTAESDYLDRESDILLSCPLVSHVVIEKPTLWAPFYRVVWGFRE